MISPASRLASPSAAESDWPQYRGPNRDGISPETGLRKSWPEGGPPELWRVRLGEGYSGIAAVGDRLFTLYARGGEEYVAALTGRPSSPKAFARCLLETLSRE